MYSINYIKSIFSSSEQDFRLDMQLIHDISFLLEKELIYLDKKISDIKKKDYHHYIEGLNNQTIKEFDIIGGGIAHLALKLIGV